MPKNITLAALLAPFNQIYIFPSRTATHKDLPFILVTWVLSPDVYYYTPLPVSLTSNNKHVIAWFSLWVWLAPGPGPGPQTLGVG